MNYLNNSEFVTQKYSSKMRFSLPFKNYTNKNISFKDSFHLINSEKKPNNHRQYLIDFIRDNNNTKIKSPSPKNNISKQNHDIKSTLEKVEEESIDNKIDKNNFFNDYFYQQIKIEKNEYNKCNKDKFMDINDYIGEDSKRPIDLEIMNVKMNNFQPGRISSKSFGLINAYAANTNQGIDRNYNDDRVKIMINMNRPNNYRKKAPWPLISFFAIFDGHNGDHCAEFLRQNLLQYIYTNPNFPNNIEMSIKEAFSEIDKDYLKNYSFIKSRNNRVSQNSNLDYYNNSGSCGLILLIVDTKIFIGNVGDSRCIMSCDNGKIQKDVTRDHKPEFPYEKARIYDNGGNIYRNESIFNEQFRYKSHNKILLGPFRVNPGKLSVSRTIGDAKAKLEKLGGIPNVIIPEPDIYIFDIYKDNIDYFILGCDGIFDRLKSYEVFQCVNIIINKTKELIENNNKFNNSFNTSYDKKINMSTTCGNIVDMILRTSMLRKSFDNVTCIMVSFKDLLLSNNNINIEVNKNEYILKKDKANFHFNDWHKNKDINIINSNSDNYNNKFEHKIESINNNTEVNLNNIAYKDINKYNNTYNNNFLIVDNKNTKENDIVKNKSENKTKINNHSRIPSQSQEKKIRELISLFSINNKKGTNNDNSKLLYQTYGSKNDIIKDQQKSDITNTKALLLNNSNNNSNNLALSQEDKEKIKLIRNEDNDNLDNTEKRKRIPLFKKNNIELRTSQNIQNNYSYIIKKKSFINDSNDNLVYFNTFSSSNRKENEKTNNYDTEKIKILNKNKEQIKSNINLYETPTKTDNFSKRITTRKIVRKTGNIFKLRSNMKEDISNNDNNLTLNNKNNFFTSIISSNNGNNKYANNKENIDNIKKSSININIRKIAINVEKYKHRNLRYNNNENDIKDKEKENENKINNKGYKELLNKSGKIENKIMHNINLPLSSSLGIIYTKKNKIK